MLEFYAGFLSGMLCFSLFILFCFGFLLFKYEVWQTEINSKNFKG